MGNVDISIANGVIYDSGQEIGRYELQDGMVTELFVEPEERVETIGGDSIKRPIMRPLLEALCHEARDRGYEDLVLDVIISSEYEDVLHAQGFDVREGKWVKRL